MLNAYKLLWCLQLRMEMYSMSVFRITYLLRTLLHQYRQAVIRAHHYRNQRHAKTENNDKSRKPTQTNKEIDKKNCSNFHANARKINHRLNVWRKAVAMTRTTEARRTDWQATQSDRSNYSTRSTLHHMCMDAASVLILFTKPHVIVFGSDDGVHIEPANAVTSSSRNFSRPTCAASAPANIPSRKSNWTLICTKIRRRKILVEKAKVCQSATRRHKNNKCNFSPWTASSFCLGWIDAFAPARFGLDCNALECIQCTSAHCIMHIHISHMRGEHWQGWPESTRPSSTRKSNLRRFTPSYQRQCRSASAKKLFTLPDTMCI